MHSAGEYGENGEYGVGGAPNDKARGTASRDDRAALVGAGRYEYAPGSDAETSFLAARAAKGHAMSPTENGVAVRCSKWYPRHNPDAEPATPGSDATATATAGVARTRRPQRQRHVPRPDAAPRVKGRKQKQHETEQ